MTLRQQPRTGTQTGQKKITLEDTYLLCVEPVKPHKLFQINLGTQEAEEIHLSEEHRIDNKIAREAYKMDELLDRKTHEQEWFFQNETAKSYRNQMVPFYLLQVESDKYPVYVDNSNIDESLTKDFKICSIKVNMSESIKETLEHEFPKSAFNSSTAARRSMGLLSGSHVQEGLKSPPPQIERIENIDLKDISLLTTADKLIKMCEKKVEKQAKGRQFAQDPNRKQILKFKNVDSYLYGETQLIYFVEIRQFLRSKVQHLELVFISLNVSDMNNAPGANAIGHAGYEFPPILQVNSKMISAQRNMNASMIENTPGGLTRKSQTSMIHDQSQIDGVRQGSMRSILQSKPSNDASFIRQNTKIYKTIDEQIATRFRNVSLFGWYAPEQLQKSKREHKMRETLRQTDGSAPLDASMQYITKPCPFQPTSSTMISNKKRNQGNVLAIREPNKGYIPYSAGHEILKSCDINFPLKIDLLCVRELARSLQSGVSSPKSDAFKIPMMQYVVPQEPVCNEIQNLLAECQALSRNNQREDQNMVKNLVNPLSNHGVNKHFADGFNSLKFQLRKPKGKVKMRSKKPFSMIPWQVQVQAALYLGCKRISCFSYSKPTLYGNEIDFSGDYLQFYKPKTENKLQKQKEQGDDVIALEARGELIRINCLPSCTRLCLNVILIPEPGSCSILKPDKKMTLEQKSHNSEEQVKYHFVQKEGFVFGSCQVSLFDENFLIRQGRREMRLWPFEMYNPRMVCQGECFNRETLNANFNPNRINQCMSLQIEFQSFAGKVGWRLQKPDLSQNERDVPQRFQLGEQKLNTLNPLNHAHSKLIKGKTQITRVDLEKETESLKQVKKLLDAYPMELDDDEAESINVETVLEYRNYIHKLPIFIKLIDFTDHEKIRKCYETLDSSGLAKDMLPEEALALLDGLFGDIKVRIFAVRKLSMLNDSQIALFMPQLVQALKYELFHHSPLAEFLLEKALHNTRVVGHAFFWSLKANLHKYQPHSRERFFLILERFLMCCGQFKNDFFKQNLVNVRLVEVFEVVNKKLKENSKKNTEKIMAQVLKKEEIRIKMIQQLVITHGRFDDMIFKKGRLVPLEIGFTEANTKNTQELDSSEQQDLDSIMGSQHRRGSGKSAGDQTLLQRRGSGKPISSGSKNSDRMQYEFDAEEIINFVDRQVESSSQIPKNIYYKNLKVDWAVELIYIPFNPKTPFASFAGDGRIFMSKQVPLLIVINLATERETEAALRAQNSMEPHYDPQFLASIEEAKEEEENLLHFDKKQSRPSQNKSGQLIIPISEDDNQLLSDQHVTRNDQENDEKKEKREQKKFLFKNGDDLGQDNLVLQFFKIMDRLWQTGGLELQMVCYDVMESGYQKGYIEFVDDAQVITRMHWDKDTHKEKNHGGYNMSFWKGPFDKTTVMKYVMNKVMKRDMFTLGTDSRQVRKKLDNYHWNFLHSLAGQCVATYVLGIRDRHPGNFMLENKTGKFFHIDFGHFLGHGKHKLGFNRDREPFIFSDELHYFLKYFSEVEIKKVQKDSKDEEAPETAQQRQEDLVARDPGMVVGTPMQGGPMRDMDNFAGALQQTQMYQMRSDYHEKEAGKQPEHKFEIVFNDPSKKLPKLKSKKGKPDGKESKHESTADRDRYRPPEWFEDKFEVLASRAFLEIRQNADIFINLLILMLVSDLDELDQQSISFIKNALFLNVSEEEATVSFKQEIDHARKQWFRPFDNLAHVLNDEKKERKAKADEEKRKKKEKKDQKKP